jgi:hypothetical protein
MRIVPESAAHGRFGHVRAARAVDCDMRFAAAMRPQKTCRCLFRLCAA